MFEEKLFIDNASIECPECGGEIAAVIYSDKDRSGIWIVEGSCVQCEHSSGELKRFFDCYNTENEEIFESAREIIKDEYNSSS